MIPADIGAELARVIRAAVATGELPASAAGLRAAGSWRPAPASAGGGPGTYATSLPFALARIVGGQPGPMAARLAASLGDVGWISTAEPTGDGYLTCSVTTARLAGLATRVLLAGPAVADSDAMTGTRLTAPHPPDLTIEPDWSRAWRAQHDALVGLLAGRAGADVLLIYSQRNRPPASPAATAPSPVAAAVAYHGLDAVRYALARTAKPQAAAIDRQLGLPQDVANPFVLVRYASVDAASTLRWAVDLGLTASAASPGTATALEPPELRLLDAISWLPERLAAAARRRRPAELAAHLEQLAAAWLECSEDCPALPVRGRRAAADPAGRLAAARLELAAAARAALAAGFDLLGMTAPDRL